MPKLYKNPIKGRFIAPALKCTLQPLSRSINFIFKLLLNRIQSYNMQNSFFLGVKCLLTRLNSQPAIEAVENLNGHNKAMSIMFLDFWILYINIPHGKIIKVLKEHIDICFTLGKLHGSP